MKNQDYFNEAIKEAKKLPSHVGGELQPHYKFFNEENKRFTAVLFCGKATPVNVLEALNPHYSGAERYYIKPVPTYWDNGDLMKMAQWERKLMYHKAWSRSDVEVKQVTFDIVGLKRETSKLNAGVLITNIKFIK